MGKRGVSWLSTVDRLRHENAALLRKLDEVRAQLDETRQKLKDARARGLAVRAAEDDLDAALERLGRVTRERDALSAALAVERQR